MTDQDRSFDPRRARRQLLLLSVALFLGVGALVGVLIRLYGYESVRDGWDALRPAVTAIKWGGMTVLVVRWDGFIRWVARRQRMSDAYRDYLLSMRWRVAIGLVILEALIGQNLLARLSN